MNGTPCEYDFIILLDMTGERKYVRELKSIKLFKIVFKNSRSFKIILITRKPKKQCFIITYYTFITDTYEIRDNIEANTNRQISVL